MIAAGLHKLDEFALSSSRCRNATTSSLRCSRRRICPCSRPRPRPRPRRLIPYLSPSTSPNPRRCRWRSLKWERKRRFCEGKCPTQKPMHSTHKLSARRIIIVVFERQVNLQSKFKRNRSKSIQLANSSQSALAPVSRSFQVHFASSFFNSCSFL